MEPAIVLLSGGQDSTTCLYWAKQYFDPIRTVAFDYGQRHGVELALASENSKRAGALSHEMLPVEALQEIGGAALVDRSIEIEAETSEGSANEHAHLHNLPSTFVPGRNFIFLGLAAAYGARFSTYNLVTGVCEADHSGYPDCREVFISAAQQALTLALDHQVTILAPLLARDKSRTFELAEDLEVLDVILEHTHTCYKGDRSNRFDWGYGCGECPACLERAKGFTEFLEHRPRVA